MDLHILYVTVLENIVYIHIDIIWTKCSLHIWAIRMATNYITSEVKFAFMMLKCDHNPYLKL